MATLREQPHGGLRRAARQMGLRLVQAHLSRRVHEKLRRSGIIITRIGTMNPEEAAAS
jgi:hypothetical protein